MTRINASIQPKELTDKHLLSEIRELPRIFNTIKSGKAKVKNATNLFKLGSGHVTFFYNKLQYLIDRHKSLIEESNLRNFKTIDYSECYENLPKDLLNNWTPSSDVRDIIKKRISERLSTMKNIKYNRESITIETAIDKLN